LVYLNLSLIHHNRGYNKESVSGAIMT